jgi:hypothetical protein
MGFPINLFFWSEPQLDLFLSTFKAVGTMKHVSSKVDALISTQTSGVRVGGLGLAHVLPTSGNSIVTFPYHGTNSAFGHVASEIIEKGLFSEVLVVFFEVSFVVLDHLHGSHFKSF